MLKGHKKLSETSEQAEIVGLNILKFLASDEKRFARFVSLSGLNIEQVSQNAQSPEFLGSLFDYLLSDETLLQVFCANEIIDPAAIGPLRRKLPGAPVEY